MKKALIVKDLCKSFKSKEVLSKITFDLKEGEITCLVGPSGSGKTTLLRCLSLLEDFERGEIILPFVGISRYVERRLKLKVRTI